MVHHTYSKHTQKEAGESLLVLILTSVYSVECLWRPYTNTIMYKQLYKCVLLQTYGAVFQRFCSIFRDLGGASRDDFPALC